MIRRVLVLLSLGLNAGLALACWQLWIIPKLVTPTTVPPRVMRLAAELSLEGGPTQRPPVVGQNAPPWRWSDLASTDFIAYRDNLRAVGCPEKTVRDILESELDHWFFERSQPIADALQPRFWDLAAQRGRDAFEEIEGQLQQLWEEREKLSASILDDRTQEINRFPPREAFARQYYWLPADVQSQLADLDAQYSLASIERAEEIKRRENSEPTPEDRARDEQLRSEYEAAHRALLGDFADEYDLRNSGSNWAGGLAGFEPTEEEWRAVTRAQTELNAAVQRMPRDASFYAALMMQRYGIMPGNSPENQEVADIQARYDTAVRDIFGPERYTEYQRAGDEAYRQTRRVTQRLGLDDNAAIRAWDIQRDTQAAIEQLRAIPELDAAGRQIALNQIVAEAAGALQHTLGDRGFATYQQYAGQWLQTPHP